MIQNVFLWKIKTLTNMKIINQFFSQHTRERKEKKKKGLYQINFLSTIFVLNKISLLQKISKPKTPFYIIILNYDPIIWLSTKFSSYSLIVKKVLPSFEQRIHLRRARLFIYNIFLNPNNHSGFFSMLD